MRSLVERFWKFSIFAITMLISFTSSCGDEEKQEIVKLEILEVQPKPFSVFLDPVEQVLVKLNRNPSDFELKVWKDESEIFVVESFAERKGDEVFAVAKFQSPLSEGTYLALFEAEDIRYFWYFSVGEKKIPSFTPRTIPKDGSKNFPYDQTVALVFEKLANPFSFDEDTLTLLKRAREGDFKINFEPSFNPSSNLLFIFLQDIEEGTYYTFSATGIFPVFEVATTSPFSMGISTTFRTVDFSPPSLVGCYPHFCASENCISYPIPLTFLEFDFEEGEELLPESVPENIKVYRLSGSELVEYRNRKVTWFPSFEKPQKLFEEDPEPGEIWIESFIYPSKVIYKFSEPISSQTIHIFILQKLADVSGNEIGQVLKWCINIR